MAVEDHHLFLDWSAAWDSLQSRRRHYTAAKEIGNELLIRTMKEKLDVAEAEYEKIVSQLDA